VKIRLAETVKKENARVFLFSIEPPEELMI